MTEQEATTLITPWLKKWRAMQAAGSLFLRLKTFVQN
jgi:hypothetical protein